MKKVKIRFLKTSNAIIAGLIALLGFAASCEKDSKVEYGTPSAKFIVNGKVVSSNSNQAIENIRVVMKGDTTRTDSEGKYQVVDEYGFPGSQSYDIQFRDTDGAANGDFQDLDTIVEFVDPQYSNGSGNWYSGEATEELDIELNPKK